MLGAGMCFRLLEPFAISLPTSACLSDAVLRPPRQSPENERELRLAASVGLLHSRMRANQEDCKRTGSDWISWTTVQLTNGQVQRFEFLSPRQRKYIMRGCKIPPVAVNIEGFCKASTPISILVFRIFDKVGNAYRNTASARFYVSDEPAGDFGMLRISRVLYDRRGIGRSIGSGRGKCP